MTKDKIDALLKALDRLGLGVNDGKLDSSREPQLTQNHEVLVSVIAALFV